MLAFDVDSKQMVNPEHHVEKFLGVLGAGDGTLACWEPGQTSPNHPHPNTTQINFHAYREVCWGGSQAEERFNHRHTQMEA